MSTTGNKKNLKPSKLTPQELQKKDKTKPKEGKKIIKIRAKISEKEMKEKISEIETKKNRQHQ